MELQRRPEAKVTEGVSIDDYSTWRARIRSLDPWQGRSRPQRKGTREGRDAEYYSSSLKRNRATSVV